MTNFGILLTFLTILLISFIACLVAILIFIILILTKVPFVKTPKKVLEKILSELSIKPTDIVYDLGCGDAQFLIAVEKRFGCQTIGYEISPTAFLLAKLNISLNKAKTKVFYHNFYYQDLSKADFVFCFLIDSVMPKVQRLLEKQLKKGSQVISFAFPIKEWQPTKVIDSDPKNPKASKIYFYQR
jgi:SAM-dependent methyltransferase